MGRDRQSAVSLKDFYYSKLAYLCDSIIFLFPSYGLFSIWKAP